MLTRKHIKLMAEDGGGAASSASPAAMSAPSGDSAAPAAATATPSAAAAAPSSPTSGAQQSSTGSQATGATPSEPAAQAATSEPAPAASTNADGEGTTPAGAPEAYTFTAPEGLALDDAVIADFSRVAKELNLTQDAAQKLVSELAPKLAEQTLAAQTQAYQAQVESWLTATKSDKEIGGDKLNENLAVAKKALDAFGTPELRKYLDDTGLGNHPEIVRAFYKVGQAISEDRMVPSGAQGAQAGGLSAKSVLYGDGVKK